METSEIITLAVIGVYTIIYVVVFFVQKSQIDAITGVNAQMVSFMAMFDLDRVKAYTNLMVETTKMEANKEYQELSDQIAAAKIEGSDESYVIIDKLLSAMMTFAQEAGPLEPNQFPKFQAEFKKITTMLREYKKREYKKKAEKG